jgi:hypothetical protein
MTHMQTEDSVDLESALWGGLGVVSVGCSVVEMPEQSFDEGQDWKSNHHSVEVNHASSNSSSSS